MIYTSYFAKLKSLPENIIPISICGKAPNGWKGLEYKKLAPKYDFFNKWKENHDNDYYTKCFNEQVLDKLDAREVYGDLMTLCGVGTTTNITPHIALICYEKPSDFCHRHLVSEWLTKNNILCKEWEAIELSVLNDERSKMIEERSSLEKAISNINKDITSLQIESIQKYIGKKFKDAYANYYLPMGHGTELIGKTAVQCLTFNPTISINGNQYLQPCQTLNIFLVDENGILNNEYQEVTEDEYYFAYDKFVENLKIILKNVDKKE